MIIVNKTEKELIIKKMFELAVGRIGMGQGLKKIEFLGNDYLYIESNHPMSTNMRRFLIKNLHRIINVDIIAVYRKNTVLIFKLNDI